MADQEKVDISSELRIIESDKYGKNVKDAIYDALYKLNQARIPSPGPSPGPSPEPPTGHYVPVGIPGFVCSGIVGGFSGSIDKPNRAFIRATGSQGIDCDFTPDNSLRNVKYEIEFADFQTPSSGWGSMYAGWVSNVGGSQTPGGWQVHPTDDRSYGNPLLWIGYARLFANQRLPKMGYHKYVTTISGKYVTVVVDDGVMLEYNWGDNYGGSIYCPVGLCCSVSLSGSTKTLTEFGTLDVYSFKIFQNDALVRDFVPALGDNDKPGFYDNVSQTYFYSETGTDFIYIPAETEV